MNTVPFRWGMHMLASRKPVDTALIARFPIAMALLMVKMAKEEEDEDAEEGEVNKKKVQRALQPVGPAPIADLR